MPWDLHQLQPVIVLSCLVFFFPVGLFGWLFNYIVDSFCCSMSSCIYPDLTSCSYSELLNISVGSLGMQNLRVLKSRESGALWKGEVLSVVWLPLFCYSVHTPTGLSLQHHLQPHGFPWLFTFLFHISW